MKQLLILIALIGAGFFGYQKLEVQQNQVSDPYYVELRISFPFESTNLVGFGLMHSLQECQERSGGIWRDILSGEAGSVEVAMKCKKQIPEKYNKLFNNEQFSATYLSMEPGNEHERSARFVIYGVSSSVMKEACIELINHYKKQYQGKVQCITGTVG
ncbi:hypothetical protein DU002_08545 [Corallincola holothuriorum]|uniref:Uncharacterized protein n=1 Tax=Corallincola holothuriorum TaxID=2282215 RepID=A0A368NIS0_9GAMM|nr:hypothetical protein [Corallincola holothuriorum]RCU50462.1 hypothetical protein DU002_08545 [Corallincola holothuriorum]